MTIRTADPRVTIETFPSQHDVEHIVRHMRTIDRFENISLVADWRFCGALMRMSDHCFAAYLDGEPVFAWGSVPHFPHLRELFGFGTDKTLRVIPVVTKWGYDGWLAPLFETMGTLRLEVRVPVECVQSIKWLQVIGGYIEVERLRHHGRNGGDYVQLAYTKDQYDVLLKTKAAAHARPGPAAADR